MSGYGWKRERGTAVMVMVVLVMVMVMVMTAREVKGLPQAQRRGHDSKDPIFNIWEFAITNTQNRRREATNVKDPCTWAIVRCCNAPGRAQRDSCFDDNQCAGAWFDDLCSNHFQGLARNVVHEAFNGGF